MRLAAIALIVCIMLAPARAAAQEWEVVRLSFAAGIEALPAIVAQERGFFVQERLVASSWGITSDEAVVRALAAGTVDFAVVPQRTLLMAAAARLPVTAVATSNWDAELELLLPATAADMQSMDDLRGQRIAVDDGPDTFAVLVRLLNQAGMGLSEVAVQAVPAAQIERVFADGFADAILAPARFTQPLVAAGQAFPALDHDALVRTLGVIGAQPLVTRDALIEEDADTVQRFLNAWVKALVYINQAPEDAGQLLQIFMHRAGVALSVEQAQAWLATTRFDRYDWSGRDIAELEYSGWALHEAQVFDTAPGLQGYVDNRFAEQAWRSLQGED